MAFYNDSNLELKRKNRWTLQINGVEIWMVSSFTKPSYEIGQSEYQELNYIAYKPNVLKWNPCKFTVVDGEPLLKNIKFNTTNKFYKYAFSSGHENRIREPFANITKDAAISSIGNRIVFTQYAVDNTNNGESKAIEEWTLHNPWIQSCDFGGEATYEDSEINKINCNVVYDYATFRTL